MKAAQPQPSSLHQVVEHDQAMSAIFPPLAVAILEVARIGQPRVGSGDAGIPRVAAKYDAVFHHVHGHECGRPFTCLVLPTVTKAGAAHT